MTLITTRGLLFNIAHASVHDGPGIRTVIFFKGCPMNCLWCQNPESKNPEIEYRVVNGDKKIHVGEYYTPAQVMIEIEKDLLFFQETGGGVTFSGGEPTLQTHFLRDLVEQCKHKHIHMTLETCGYFPYDLMIPTLHKIDLIYFDIKIIDTKQHAQYTGKSNQKIIKNLRRLMVEHPRVQVRYVSVPDHNSAEQQIDALAVFLSKLNIGEITILKYNSLWSNKIKGICDDSNKIKSYHFEEIESCWKKTVNTLKRKGLRVIPPL